MAEIDHFRDLAEVKILVALDEHHLLLTSGEDLFQLRLDLRLIEGGLVNLVGRCRGSVRKHLDNNGTVVRLILTLILGWLRNQRLQALWRHRHDHHEDDQQHQKNVDQWCYVDLRNGSALSSSAHSHRKSPCLLRPLDRYERAGIANT